MKKNVKRKTLRSLATLAAAAAICLASIAGRSLMPLSPVPFAIQNMLCILAACILGGAQGAGATGLFILAGGLGLPVFALGNGGIEHLTGLSGGYILGYFIAAAVSGLIAGSPFTFENDKKEFSLYSSSGSSLWCQTVLGSIKLREFDAEKYPQPDYGEYVDLLELA